MLNKAYYSKALLIAVSAGAIASLTSASALAGFEWVPGTPPAPAAKAPAETMQVQQAPVPNVSNEQLPDTHQDNAGHANEIIHVAPQAQQTAPAPAASDVMTPSPFDTVATPASAPTQPSAPETIDAPEPAINTIDFTNKAPAPDNDTNYNQDIETIEAQSLNAEEETVAMPAPMAQEPISPQTAETASEIAPVAQQPQQLVPTMTPKETAPQRPVILAYPEDPVEPTLVRSAPVTEEAVYAEAIGFGKDMPLALAIQQILPPGYAYSFAKSVNPGERVSWNGGKQWNVVLSETLEPLGLSARIQDKTVAIVPSMGELSSATVSSESEADNAVYTIEPASGLEQEIQSPDISTETLPSQRLIIRDPGEQETGQPGMSKSALLKPAENTALIPLDGESVVLDNEAVPLQAAAMPISGNYKWSAQAGDSLKKVMYDWAKKANVQIIWEASHDYTLSADFASSEPVGIALENLMKTALQNETIPAYRMLNNSAKKNQMALIIVQDPPQAEIAASAAAAG